MSVKMTAGQAAKIQKGAVRDFVTVDEVMSHFLPEQPAQTRMASGKDLGAEVAARTFAEVLRHSRAQAIARKP
jgi:hypothetical protein